MLVTFKTMGCAVLWLLLGADFAPVALAQDAPPSGVASAQASKSSTDQARRQRNRLVGVWDVVVTVRVCDTGFAITTFRAMDMYGADGSLADTNVFPPGARGPGFGTWRHVKGRTFTSVTQFYEYDSAGTFTSVREPSSVITLAPDGKSYTADVSIKVFDPFDNLIGTGCATADATRAF